MPSNIPSDWYEQQAQQAAQDLDLDLHLAVGEAELKDAISANFDPMPERVPDNSVYNLNDILDNLLD
jgi:hypothetical protein